MISKEKHAVNGGQTFKKYLLPKHKEKGGKPATHYLLFRYFNTLPFRIKHAHQASGCVIIVFFGQQQVNIITLCSKINGDLIIL